MLRKVTGLDIYDLYATQLPEIVAEKPLLPEGHRLIRLEANDDLSACDSQLLGDIDAHSGSGASVVIAHGGCIYAIARSNVVLSQLQIERHASHVDSPIPMTLQLGERDAFLSFLYTTPDARRGGWAKKLVALVCADLASRGHLRCVCHVRSTNVLSIRTFRALGWKRVGMLVATTGKKFVGLFRVAMSPLPALEICARPDQQPRNRDALSR